MIFYKHYIGDFQRDTGHLSLTERGAYRALIDHYYATEKPLPNDHPALCRIAGAFTKAERDAVKVAMGFFEVKEGQLWHHRIEAELEKQEGRCDKNRAIALAREERKRAEKRAREQHDESTNRAPNVPDSLHDQSTNQNQNQNQSSSLRSEDTNAQGADDEPEPFDVFWTEYPKKVGKGAAQRAWAKIKRPKETLEAMLLALAWQKKSEQWTRDGGQYIPNPATYLNQQRWMDEPPTGRMQRQQQRVHHDISAMDYTRGVDNEGRF